MSDQKIDQEVVVKVMGAMRSVVDAFAADRPRYVAAFKSNWTAALCNAETFAEDFFREPLVEFDQAAREAILAPYDMIVIMVMARLMDHLTIEEEDWLRETAGKLQSAWQKLLAAMYSHHPDVAALCERAYGEYLIVHEETLGLFCGELPPYLTPRWGKAYQALQDDLVVISGEVRK